jgi:NADH dehydrogenase
MTQPNHHVVIIGGGFAGLTAARQLRKAPVHVTLVDRRNFHLFQPLLYQVATGGLSPANIASPLRRVLRRAENVQVLLGEAVGFDVQRRQVKLADTTLDYDTLIVGTGVRHQYFGHEEWEKYAPGLKSVEDATEMRRRILTAFEAAERQLDAARRDPWLTFVVIGGGPTGVELAGSLGELSHNTLKHDFRTIDPAAARIILLEAGDRILPTFPPELSAKAVRSLERLGVTVRTGAKVTEVAEHGVTIETGGQSEHIEAYTVLWGAGVKASPLGAVLAQATGATLDRAGRVIVEPDFSLHGHPRRRCRRAALSPP